MRIRRTSGIFPLLLFGLLILALGFGIVAKEQSIFASAISSGENSSSEEKTEHYITIYDGGQSFTVKGNAATVAEALKRMEVELNDGDIVEPGLDEAISDVDYNINIYRAREVVVSDGKTKKYLKTASINVDDVVKDAGIKLLQADEVKIENQNNILESGMTTTYVVHRAKTVKLNYYGKHLEVRTQAKNIGDFLNEQNISTDTAENWVSVALDSKVKDGVSFEVMRQGKHTMVQEEDIPYNTKTTRDFDLDMGVTKVTQAGQIGKKEVTYEVDMYNGVEISRNYVSEIITKAPVEEQVTVGAKVVLPPGSHEDWMAAAGIGAGDYGYVNFIVNHESHWNPLAVNAYSGATGLCQALPGSKMASAGADWATNPITQLRWCNGYAVGRYGSWAAAYQFWVNNKWW